MGIRRKGEKLLRVEIERLSITGRKTWRSNSSSPPADKSQRHSGRDRKNSGPRPTRLGNDQGADAGENARKLD